MEIITLHRKLLLNCTSTTPCTDPYYCCVYASSSPPAPSPSPSPVADQSQPSPHHGHNHAVPYVVSAACLLGVLSLILTTCTILLRHRFSRSRRSASSRDPHSAPLNQHRAPVDHPIWHIVTVGLPQSVIDSIASVKYKSSEGLIEESDCSVCLTGFEDGDDLRLLPKCSHAFHLPCIDTWLRSHKNCPLCRSPVVSDSPPPVNVNLSDSSPNSSSTSPSETALIENSGSLDDHDIDSSHVEGAEVWKSDPEKGILSDLGAAREDFEAVRRSISLDSPAAGDNVGTQTGEGSSQQEKIEGEEADKEGHNGESGISRLIKSSSSIGRSSAKILSSFRGGKSQSSSTLPHL